MDTANYILSLSHGEHDISNSNDGVISFHLMASILKLFNYNPIHTYIQCSLALAVFASGNTLLNTKYRTTILVGLASLIMQGIQSMQNQQTDTLKNGVNLLASIYSFRGLNFMEKYISTSRIIMEKSLKKIGISEKENYFQQHTK